MKYKKHILILSAAAVALWLWITNTSLQVNVYPLSFRALPEAFSGFRIAQISDLHNARFGKDNEILLQKLKQAQPDIIAITGDYVDSRQPDVDSALTLAEKMAAIAPCYYVSGNHEMRLPQQSRLDLEAGLIGSGVTILHGNRVTLRRGEDTVTLTGVEDFSGWWHRKLYLSGPDDPNVLSALPRTEGFTVLLSHRPELFDAYVSAGFDLTLTGHAHGGQFRIPFVGGLFVPDQGFFPEFDGGVYRNGECAMVISRGIGNSVIPVRINNPPEIVIIELQRG